MPLTEIRKRDGRIVDFNSTRIKDAVHKAFIAVELQDGERAESLTREIVRRLEAKFKEKICTVDDAQDFVIEVLREKGFGKVAREYQAYRKKKDEIRKLRAKLGIEEPKLTVNALEVLRRRYLLKDMNEKVIETPSRMFMRVAKAVAISEKKHGGDPKEWKRVFYEMMAKLEFIPNSPTLFNAGTKLAQLSACFVLPIDDSLESIFTAVKNMAVIEKTGGGVGFDFSRLRPKVDIVRSTRGVASGPVSFMRVFDTATEVIKAGGKRRGAMMGILRVDHPDILDFIVSKHQPGFLSNFNISVGITDNFMKTLEENGEYWLINPRNKEKASKLIAKDVWNLMAKSAWQSGDPGIVFVDEINRHNPTPQIGKIESTNPCITSDVWIMTEKGPRQVKELCGREFTAVVNREKWKTSEGGFFSTGIKSVYQLKTKEGFELRLTKNHPILKIKEMTKYKVETVWTTIENLKKGDKVVLNNHRGFDRWNRGKYSEKEGYLIGLLLGDGTIKKDKAILSSWGEEKGSRTVRASAFAFANALPHRSDFTGWVKVKNRGEYHMALGYLKRLAAKLGLEPRTKTITAEMEKSSSEFCIGLLRGLFDSDGSMQWSQHKGVSIRLAQSNLEILKAVQRILLRFGIFAKIYKKRRDKGFSKMPNGKGGVKEYLRKPQHELVISKENILYFCRSISFGNSDKMVRLEKAAKSYRRRMNRERFIAMVEEIIPRGEEQVYDVKIPGKNAFDANGFIVHNCGEQPLLPYESCNLGSVNLSRMVFEGGIDWEKLRETVRSSVRFLDDVIDANEYPLKETAKITWANRKIGLGVMGFADLLVKLGVPYNSEQALKLGEELMKFIEEEGHKMSVELGEERGSFSNFDKSLWADKYNTMRNATVTTIAPTGSISIIAGCSSGIEPFFAISFIRNVLSGTRLFETNPLFEAMAKERGFYSAELLEQIAETGSVQKIDGVPEDVKEIFATALDIDPEWHVKMQAVFQKHTDNAVSKTVNLPAEATTDDVRKVYDLAWKLKCKGVTVFRYGSKPEQVLYIGEVNTGKGKFITAESEYAGGCPAYTCPFPG